ncbi:hypothetical protein LCGC14_1196870, partial [marine sediment metagenome]
NDSHVLIDEDYGTGVLRLPSLRYYIYLTREGQYWVDVSAPVYTKARYGYYHPIYVYRYVAEFYMDVNNKIPFTVSQEQNPGQIIVVASSTYKGLKYDRICDGTRDEVEINDAIRYLSETYGGGIVELTEGTFYTAAPIVPDDNIVLQGRGWNTIVEKNGNFTGIELIGGSGSEYTGVKLKDFKITRNSADSNGGVYLINLTYVDNLILDNILLYDAYTDALKIANCSDFLTFNCNVQRFKDWGLYYTGSQGIISNCVADGDSISTANSSRGIIAVSCTDTLIVNCRAVNLAASNTLIGIYLSGNGNKIDGCFVKNLTVSTADIAYGIWATNDQQQIINNYVDDIDNTNTAANANGIKLKDSDDSLVSNNYIINGSGIGLLVDSDSIRALVNSNFCRANGSDSGITNENEHNFSDAGTDTMTEGNSWGPKGNIKVVSSANYIVLDGDGYKVVLVTTGASDRTITLPTASANKRRQLTVIKADSGAGKVIIDGEGAETINGATTENLVSQYDYLKVVCDGSNWLVLDRKQSFETAWLLNELGGAGVGDWTNVHLGNDPTDPTDNLTHGLNAPISDLLYKVLISTDGTDVTSFEVVGWGGYDGANHLGIQKVYIDNNNVLIQTGANGFEYINESGNRVIVDIENWYYKIKVWKLG